MTESPLVSVIMPAFNAERYIAQAIKSICNQTYTNWELLICDDASFDGTEETARQFSSSDSRVVVFKNLTNEKPLRVRNALLEIAKGEFLTFQDADDFSHPERLEKLVEEFERNPRLGLLSSQVGYVDAEGKHLRISKKPTTYDSVIREMYSGNVVGGAIMMVKRAALDLVGGQFRPYLDGLSYQDYDLSLLISERFEAYALSEVLYYYRQHPASGSKVVSIDRILAKDLVIHLANQRRERGTDDVMDGKLDKVQAKMDELRSPYRNDPSLVYREYAAQFMYNRMFGPAIATAFLGVRKCPGALVNWRTLQYCLRKSVTSSFSNGY